MNSYWRKDVRSVTESVWGRRGRVEEESREAALNERTQKLTIIYGLLAEPLTTRAELFYIIMILLQSKISHEHQKHILWGIER